MLFFLPLWLCGVFGDFGDVVGTWGPENWCGFRLLELQNNQLALLPDWIGELPKLWSLWLLLSVVFSRENISLLLDAKVAAINTPKMNANSSPKKRDQTIKFQLIW